RRENFAPAASTTRNVRRRAFRASTRRERVRQDTFSATPMNNLRSASTARLPDIFPHRATGKRPACFFLSRARLPTTRNNLIASHHQPQREFPSGMLVHAEAD